MLAMSRRSRKAKSDKVTGVALAVLGIVLIAGLAGGAFWIKRQQVPIGEDNCPTTGPNAIHIILIDRSDPITGQQAQHVRQWGQRLAAPPQRGPATVRNAPPRSVTLQRRVPQANFSRAIYGLGQ